MMALRLLMLLVTVAVIYLLFLRSQTPSTDLPPDLVQSAATAAPGESPGRSPQAAHSQYKEAMDRAHAAAKLMQDQHKDADSF